MRRIRILSGNVLKIIAAISMVIDHIGFMFFPDLLILRLIGRIAFPIFAVMIAEGAKYTKNKLRYFLTIFLLGIICQVVYYFFDDHSLYMSILITFSLSILLIYMLQLIKYIIFNTKTKLLFKILLPVVIIPLSIVGLYFLNLYVEIDYGFWGILTPVFMSIVDFRNIKVPKKVKIFDNYYLRLLLMSICLIMLTITGQEFQWACLFTIPLLLFYSEKRGKLKLKYFFYLFYPLHLVVLQGIQILIELTSK